jgi:hypothetical protein
VAVKNTRERREREEKETAYRSSKTAALFKRPPSPKKRKNKGAAPNTLEKSVLFFFPFFGSHSLAFLYSIEKEEKSALLFFYVRL